MRISDGTIRVVWGTPRQVADVDLATGTIRPTDLVPESYRYGCPELSPDGTQLIFEGYDKKNRPHIFYAANPQGRDAEPIVSSVEPTYDSQPLWLSSSREFVFDQDLQHPAVFALSTNTLTILPDSARMGDSQNGFNKSVSRTGDHIAIVQTTSLLNVSVYVYNWPALNLETRFVAGAATYLWRFGADPSLLYGQISRDTDQLVSFDSRTRRLAFIARISGREIVDSLQVGLTTAAIVTRRFEVNAWWKDSAGIEHQIPHDQFASYTRASLTDDGDVLLVRNQGRRWNIVSFRPSDGSFRDLSAEDTDFEVSALPNGDWLMVRYLPNGAEILQCQHGEAPQQCHLVTRSPSAYFLAASPGGKYFVYETMDPQGSVIRVGSLEDGRAVELARDASLCQLVWSGPTTVWISRKQGDGYQWVEMNVESKRPTGLTAPGGTNCANGELDPSPPVSGPVRVAPTHDYDVRIHRLP